MEDSTIKEADINIEQPSPLWPDLFFSVGVIASSLTP